MQKFIFSIPDSNSNNISLDVVNVRLLNWAVLEAIKLHKEWFYDDFVIETAYGCPPGCKWNGNRSLGDTDEYDGGWSKAVFGMYAGYGVKYRLIFTNFLLKREHLKDQIGNAVAKALSKVGGYVMVSTRLMANHMARYPGLEVNWSTTTDFGKTKEEQIVKINELSKNSLVVLPYEFNNKPELKQFTSPQNLEVLVNERCIDNCPRRREHWMDVNRMIIGQMKEEEKLLSGACRFSKQYGDGGRRKHHILRDMLEEYQQMGINHFKISGRVEPEMVMTAYKEYFVKQEHLGDVEMYIKKFLERFLSDR